MTSRTADVEKSADQDRSDLAQTANATKAIKHEEKHSMNSELVRDSIIGLADGLTVPFALTAGLSALGSSRVVVIAGLAELFSGAISMGLGAFLASSTETQHYKVEEKRERREVLQQPEAEKVEIYEIFDQYGIDRDASRHVVNALIRDEEKWVKFMMDFELKLSKPAASRAWIEGVVTGVAYFIGGLFPMIPYFAIQAVNTALFVSIGITAAILLIFGYVKAIVTGNKRNGALYSALQTLLIGASAAAVSYGVVRGIDSANTL